MTQSDNRTQEEHVHVHVHVHERMLIYSRGRNFPVFSGLQLGTSEFKSGPDSEERRV